MSNEVVKKEERGATKEETTHQLSVLLQKVIGMDDGQDLTKEQKDELLSQRRQISEYIHEDKKRSSFDNRFHLIAALVFVLLFSGLVLWQKPDVFEQVLALVVGLFGGGAGGYALGRRSVD